MIADKKKKIVSAREGLLRRKGEPPSSPRNGSSVKATVQAIISWLGFGGTVCLAALESIAITHPSGSTAARH